MQKIKENKMLIGMVIYLIISLSFGVWTYQKMKLYELALTSHANEIISQKAAWQVLLSNLTPEQQQTFMDTVNKTLKPN